MPAEPVFSYDEAEGGGFLILQEEEETGGGGNGHIRLQSPYQQRQSARGEEVEEVTSTSSGSRSFKARNGLAVVLFLLLAAGAAGGAALLRSKTTSTSTTTTSFSGTDTSYESRLQEAIKEHPLLEMMAPRYVSQMIIALQEKEEEEEESLKKSWWKTKLFGGSRASSGSTSRASRPPGPPEIPQGFSLDAIFGDNMVLQHSDGGKTQAAIYGFLGPNCSGVLVKVLAETEKKEGKKGLHVIYNTTKAMINATQQPFGEGWGVRPCSKEDCPPYGMIPYNPWNQPLPTWKVLLPPQSPGGNYTIQATCLLKKTELEEEERQDHYGPTVNITNVTFGDVWYCSGQSNMQLPLMFTFQKNTTIQNMLQHNKYSNIRIMAGRSKNHPYHNDHPNAWHTDKYGSKGGTNAWMTAKEAAMNQPDQEKRGAWTPFLEFGAACWYFAESLSDLGITHPIGLANTAIGGQRIQEYMDNATIGVCQNRTSPGQTNTTPQNLIPWWDGELYATQVLPFADMTLKGFLWYQGENNMFDLKGNSAAGLGYGCEMKKLIQDWRTVWSKVPYTTSPTAPFGIVTLASSGSEGGPDMGSMRLSQTANYGVLPHDDDLPNTFLAQAYDLDDEWGPDTGPCFENKCCQCGTKYDYDPSTCTNKTLYKLCNGPNAACKACQGTPTMMGGIHPRSKRFVGSRLAIAAYNTVYGGKDAFTGPTLAGCSLKEMKNNKDNKEEETLLSSNKMLLEIRFNKKLLRGDKLLPIIIPPNTTKILPRHRTQPAGGSQLWVQTDTTDFCMEEHIYYDGKTESPHYVCPEWAGGTKEQASIPRDVPYGDGESWIRVNFTLAPGSTDAIHVDLTPLKGSKPTAVRYAWNFVDCCDYTDPLLWITHSCIANCPLQSAKNRLPANPFQARIVDGECQCVAPQVCSDHNDGNKGDDYDVPSSQEDEYKYDDIFNDNIDVETTANS